MTTRTCLALGVLAITTLGCASKGLVAADANASGAGAGADNVPEDGGGLVIGTGGASEAPSTGGKGGKGGTGGATAVAAGGMAGAPDTSSTGGAPRVSSGGTAGTPGTGGAAAVSAGGTAGKPAEDGTGGMVAAVGGGAGQGGEPSSSLPSSVRDAFAHCSFAVTGEPTVTQTAVPTDLSDLPWAFTASACKNGGWDLPACSGEQVEQTALYTGARGGIVSGPMVAVALTLNDSLCCVYQYEELPPDNSFAGSTVSPANCGPAYPGLAALTGCSIPLSSDDQRSVEQLTLPQELTGDAIWGPRESICADGGYDLSRCAGAEATLFTAVEARGEANSGEPTYYWSAWVVTQGDDVCCLWETDGRPTPSLLASPCAGVAP